METNLSHMKIIADNFLSCVKTVKINTKHPQYRLRTTSFDGNQKLIDYLNTYNLYSSKWLDYLDWKDSFLLIKNKLIDTDQGKNEIEKKKNQINDKRTIFTWNHLCNFIDN